MKNAILYSSSNTTSDLRSTSRRFWIVRENVGQFIDQLIVEINEHISNDLSHSTLWIMQFIIIFNSMSKIMD